MTKPQAQAVLNHLNDFLDRRLNHVFDDCHKKVLMGEMNNILSDMIPQPQQAQPQPDTGEIKKIKGEEITPKGLMPNENKT